MCHRLTGPPVQVYGRSYWRRVKRVQVILVSLLHFMLYWFSRKFTTEQQCFSPKIFSSQLFNNGLLAFCQFYKIVCNLLEPWLSTSQWILMYVFSLKRNKLVCLKISTLVYILSNFLIQSVASNFPFTNTIHSLPPNPFHLHAMSAYPPLVNIQERLCHLALNPLTLMRIKMNLGPSGLASVLPQAQWQQTKHDSGYTE